MTYEQELRKALATSPIPGWRALRDDGLDQYSETNVSAVERVFEDLVLSLSSIGPDAAESRRVEAFKRAVLDLNKLNDRTGGSVIETGEREQLAELINTLSQAAGLDPGAYGGGEGLASEWRDW